jgi:hypothetical protein
MFPYIDLKWSPPRISEFLFLVSVSLFLSKHINTHSHKHTYTHINTIMGIFNVC